MNLEKKMKELDREIKALKVAYQTSGSKITLITKTLNYATRENSVTENGFTYDDLERVVVTLDTDQGANTMAKLEMTGDYDTLPVVRRTAYSGGARWVVTTNAKSQGGNWTATNYQFTVQTLVNGTLTAKMIWE